MDKAYRYRERAYSAGVDQFGDPLPGYYLKLELEEYVITRRTPKGIWINLDFYKLGYPGTNVKFVLLTARKKFAALTPEEALNDFVCRKKRQIKILKARLEQAERALRMADANKLEEPCIF